jgi:hypothetical protein
MSSFVIERDTFFTDLMAGILLILSVVMFYLLGNPSPIIVILLSIFVYWVGRSGPVEYFWADEDGIEYHIGKEALHQIPWCNVDRIFVDSYGSDSPTNWAIYIKLKIKLEFDKTPSYVKYIGVLKTSLLLFEGKDNRRIFKQLKKLKEENA